MLRIFCRQTIQCSVFNKYGTSLTRPEQTHGNAVIEHVIDVIERSTLELGNAKVDKHERHDGKPAVCMRREGSTVCRLPRSAQRLTHVTDLASEIGILRVLNVRTDENEHCVEGSRCESGPAEGISTQLDRRNLESCRVPHVIPGYGESDEP